MHDDPDSALRHDIAQCWAAVSGAAVRPLSAGWWQLHDVRHETAAKCTAAPAGGFR